jgi:hypothetical protein
VRLGRGVSGKLKGSKVLRSGGGLSCAQTRLEDRMTWGGVLKARVGSNETRRARERLPEGRISRAADRKRVHGGRGVGNSQSN